MELALFFPSRVDSGFVWGFASRIVTESPSSFVISTNSRGKKNKIKNLRPRFETRVLRSESNVAAVAADICIRFGKHRAGWGCGIFSRLTFTLCPVECTWQLWFILQCSRYSFPTTLSILHDQSTIAGTVDAGRDHIFHSRSFITRDKFFKRIRIYRRIRIYKPQSNPTFVHREFNSDRKCTLTWSTNSKYRACVSGWIGW